MVKVFRPDQFSEISAIPTAPGVSALDEARLVADAAEAHIVFLEDNAISARCSLWSQNTPKLEGAKLGYVGHYAATNRASSDHLLQRACEVLREQGCNVAVGPIDGDTWHRYRFVTEAGSEPPFFLEPANPAECPGYFSAFGFRPLAEYFSAIDADLAYHDPRAARVRLRLGSLGVTVRPFDMGDFLGELRRIYEVSCVSFADNFLYTPISEDRFVGQYQRIKPVVDPRLVLIAEHSGTPVGYLFSIPDTCRVRPGAPSDTLIIKTVAALPSRPYSGLGAVLADEVYQMARQLGYQRVIHALMHESNGSRNLSGRYGAAFRRYTLFSMPLKSL